MAVPFSNYLAAYFGPLVLFQLFFVGLLRDAFRSFLSILTRQPPPTVSSDSSVRTRAFARTFIDVKSGFRNFESTTVVPELLSSCRGVVLELGAGIGNQVDRYDMARIERVIGVEPNVEMVPALRDAADKAGFGGGAKASKKPRYDIAAASAEDLAALVEAGGSTPALSSNTASLAALGIAPGSIDTLLCIQVLCSVQEPQRVIAALYELLKPGGQLVLWEHVRSHRRIDSFVQKLWTPWWALALDGCSLNRPTDSWLRSAGDWASIDLKWDGGAQNGPDLFPRISGRLIKPLSK